MNTNQVKFKNNSSYEKIDLVTYSFFDQNNEQFFSIDKEELNTFRTKLKNQNWMEVAFDMFYETYPWLYRIITDSNRSDFLFLLDMKKDDLALDLGAGWGQISIPLSRFCDVVALEGNLEKIQVIKEIANQESRNNIQYVAANISDNVFENEQFDLVVLNGGLEWISTFTKGEDPFKIQQDVLQNVYNLLKPNGVLYIGIENKYGLKYILGEKDDHTGLEDLVYLNHNSIESFYKSITEKPLRSFTHSKKEYEQMLKNSGFKNVKFFASLPDYKLPRLMTDLTNNSCTQFVQENLEFIQEFDGATGRISKLNHKLQNIYPIFSPNELANLYSSYSIIARKS